MTVKNDFMISLYESMCRTGYIMAIQSDALTDCATRPGADFISTRIFIDMARHDDDTNG